MAINVYYNLGDHFAGCMRWPESIEQNGDRTEIWTCSEVDSFPFVGLGIGSDCLIEKAADAFGRCSLGPWLLRR
jgi:hypothetical protein